MNELLDSINTLFAQGAATEFELRLLEKQATAATSHGSTAAEGYMALGLLAALRLDREAAEDNFHKGRQIAPNDLLILVNQAKVQHALGRAGDAIETIARVIGSADNDTVIRQAVHIAVSALQIDRAQQWQQRLAWPVISFSPVWLDRHVKLLDRHRIDPIDLTRYRDSIASSIVKAGFLADRGQIAFERDGHLRYRFQLRPADRVDKLTAIKSDLERFITGPGSDIVAFGIEGESSA